MPIEIKADRHKSRKKQPVEEDKDEEVEDDNSDEGHQNVRQNVHQNVHQYVHQNHTHKIIPIPKKSYPLNHTHTQNHTHNALYLKTDLKSDKGWVYCGECGYPDLRRHMT